MMDVILLQETQLRREALQDAVAAMHKVGFWCRRLDKNPTFRAE